MDNRKQKVVIKSCHSNTKLITAGVPQGSVLGPVLFLIYVNDISDRLLSLIRLFADDSSLFYSASSKQDIEGIINYDLRILGNWAAQWLIKFNPLKTVAELFTLKHVYSFPHLVFENTQIEFVENHKHLGLTLSNGGARWLSGRVSDSGARGPGFETYRRRVVSLSKTLYSPKVLVNYPGSDGSVPI